MPYATGLVSTYFNSRTIQAFYGIIVILTTVCNLLLHNALDKPNFGNEVLLSQTESYRKMLLPDICIKVLGLILGLLVYPPIMMFSVLIAATYSLLSHRIYLTEGKQMKRIISILLSIVLVLVLSACAGRNNGTKDENTNFYTISNESLDKQSTKETDNVDSAEHTGEESENISDLETDETTDKSSDILVVYFSRTGEQYTVGVIDEGNTAIVAKMIAEETGADLFEILPVDDHYPMTYSELTDVAKNEQNSGARPEYAGELPDLSKYDTIFIGAPVWWGDWPMIIDFLGNLFFALQMYVKMRY